jgi:hypothetical protein
LSLDRACPSAADRHDPGIVHRAGRAAGQQVNDELSGLRGVLAERQHRVELTIGPGQATRRWSSSAAWAFELPSGFRAEHETYAVSLSAPR